MKENITVDADEIAHFATMADAWWDANGKFRPLHQMNPVRLAYIRDAMAAHFSRSATEDAAIFSGLSLLDVGCGGGLVCEPMSRLGAEVTGIDATGENIGIAQTHAEQAGLTITYQHKTAESLASDGHQFDVVLALEIVEHVADVPAFLDAITSLVKPGGLLFMSTLNRTLKSYAMAIVGAEYVLRWLPKGTHHWHKFLRPSELVLPLEARGFVTHGLTGLVYEPFSGRWRQDAQSLDVNYLLIAKHGTAS